MTMCVARFSDPHKQQTPVSHMKLKQLADGSYALHTENGGTQSCLRAFFIIIIIHSSTNKAKQQLT